MPDKKRQTYNIRNSFQKDYEVITRTESDKREYTREWNKPGDAFEKFSLYEEYTPVRTSDDTILYPAYSLLNSPNPVASSNR